MATTVRKPKDSTARKPRPKTGAGVAELAALLAQRDAELALMNEIGDALVKQMDFGAIVDLVGERLVRMFAVRDFYIALYDRSTNLLQFPFELENGRRVHSEPLEFGRGVSSRVISERRAYRLGTIAEQEAYGSFVGRTFAEGDVGEDTESWLGVPILAGQDAIGVVILGDRAANRFTESDERVVSTIASSMGVALENARLFDETKRLLAETEQRNAELAVINEIGVALAKQLDFQCIVDAVGDRIRQIFGVSTEMIAFYDSDTGAISFGYMVDQGTRFYPDAGPLQGGLSKVVLLERRALRLNTLEEARALGASQVGDKFDAQSWLGVPVTAGERVLGLIALDRMPANAFSESDERLLSTIASSMGVRSRTRACSTRQSGC